MAWRGILDTQARGLRSQQDLQPEPKWMVFCVAFSISLLNRKDIHFSEMIQSMPDQMIVRSAGGATKKNSKSFCSFSAYIGVL